MSRTRRIRRPGAQVVLRGDLYALDRVGYVTLADAAEVRVRFRFDGHGTFPWRCDACGPSQIPACPHAATVADRLVRDLLDDIEEE